MLVYGDAGFTVDCAVRNLTDGGAYLRLPGPTPVVAPLAFIDLARDRAFNARIAWNRANELGLSFIDEIDLKAPASALDRIVRRLWMERRAR